VAAATTQVATAEKGRFTSPPTTPNPAVKGKNIWIIEDTGTSPAATVPALAAKEAADALGWKSTIYDAKNLPSNYVQGVSNAIANGANGIILVAVDCSYVKNQLQLAKSKGIAVSEVYAFDCSETNPGQPSLFTADLSFGTRWKNLEQAWEQWGADTAAYVIKGTNGNGHPLLLDNDQIAVLVSYDKGFKDRMAQCSTCKIVDTKWDAVTQGTPAAITSLIQSAVLKSPETNSAVFGSTVTSGFNQGILALGSKAKSMTVVGGLGLQDEFNLIKANKGLTATTAWPQQWIGYAAVDSINSVLGNRKTDDEGIGWRIVDNTNLAAQKLTNGVWNGVDNFRDLYKKRWGVS
jgi:ribose transport system substrate-binding protein